MRSPTSRSSTWWSAPGAWRSSAPARSVANWPRVWPGWASRCTFSRWPAACCPARLLRPAKRWRAAFESDGVRLHLDSKVTRISSQDGRPTVHVSGASVTADRLLVAAGRRANVEGLNLAAAGVELRNGRIAVDHRLRTTNRRIYAAGDVCSALPFTHNADAQARIVVRNALFAPTASTRALVVPQCTYTDPEVAQVGKTEAQLAEAGVAFDCYRLKFGELDRACAAGERDGFVELLTARGSDTILGATIVGHDAGEQIAPLCLAMANGLGLGAAGKAVLPYPTRAEYLRRLADQYRALPADAPRGRSVETLVSVMADAIQPRGYIQPGALRELWFHTGTACNLACPFCLEGSRPGDDRHSANHARRREAAPRRGRLAGCPAILVYRRRAFHRQGFHPDTALRLEPGAVPGADQRHRSDDPAPGRDRVAGRPALSGQFPDQHRLRRREAARRGARQGELREVLAQPRGTARTWICRIARPAVR